MNGVRLEGGSKRSPRSALVFSACGAALVALLLGGCGPDGRSLGTDCPDIPLYKIVYDSATDTYQRVYVSASDAGGAPLSAADLALIAQAEQHCITPAGTAVSLDDDQGSGGASGSGGSGSGGSGGGKPTDAGAD